MKISPEEWKELHEIVGECWGAENPKELSQLAYGVKFDFMTSGPGYAGDMFIVAGDEMTEPFIFVRGKDRALEMIAPKSGDDDE